MRFLRTAIATGLQFGIAAAVMLMIEIQRRVAVIDDLERRKS